MKKHLFFAILASICLSTTFILAQPSSDSSSKESMQSSMMNENKASMGQLMMKMGNSLEEQKMSADQLKKVCCNYEKDK